MRLFRPILPTLVTLLLCNLADADEPGAIRIAFNIPQEPLSEALAEWSRQSGLQVLRRDSDASGPELTSDKVSGRYSPAEALSKMLEKTGLKYEFVNDRTVRISAAETQVQGATVAKDGKKNDPPVSQTDHGLPVQPSSVENEKNRPIQLEEIVVTGSRIAVRGGGPQEVQVYTRAQIDDSGQSTVAGFLNTLPAVSVSLSDNVFVNLNSASSGTSVQLHGLPLGTTLVLLDGRRLEGSGSSGDGSYFDLNNIPLSAIEKIEVVPSGSSAIYGSDAIAGVVNIVLKKNMNGFEANIGYGAASNYDEKTADAAWGKRWDRGSLSIIGSFKSNGELLGTERAISANHDWTSLGGTDQRVQSCDPGNVYSLGGKTPLPGAPPGSNATYAAVSSTVTGGSATLADFKYGTLNECSSSAALSVIPEHHQFGVLSQGSFYFSTWAELFTQVIFNRTELTAGGGPPELTGYAGTPGYHPFTVSASNPYNPFGTKVGVDYSISGLGRTEDDHNTDFLQTLIGGRGDFLEGWHWEITNALSLDRTDEVFHHRLNTTAIRAALNSTNPATALNVFTAGPAASPQVLSSLVQDETASFHGRLFSVNGFVRGPIFAVPAGSIQIVLGGEYEQAGLNIGTTYLAGATLYPSYDFHRETHSFFGEARIPLIGRLGGTNGLDFLTATVAGRYDHYSDFGNTTNPQVGVELRPVKSLLVRGTFSKAFLAPTLLELHLPQSTYQSTVIDPLNGNSQEVATIVYGGNSNLRPETATSWTAGFLYSSAILPGLQISATNWNINSDNSIQTFDNNVIVKSPSDFPSAVTRAGSCPGLVNCPIIQVDTIYSNFGEIHVRGVDYQLDYQTNTSFGELIPSLIATQTFHYTQALTPASIAVSALGRAQDSGNWAPRWKGTAGLTWKVAGYSTSVDSRYVSRYQDYDSARSIGNLWFVDANFAWTVGQTLAPEWLKDTNVSIGGVNIFNRLPQYSNFGSGRVGYDPAQSDIRGRFLYVRVGAKF